MAYIYFDYPAYLTVSEFANANPIGTYILFTDTDEVTVADGDYEDRYGEEVVLYYFKQEVQYV